MNTEQFASLFPLGSHLCREPMPSMSELKHDMELLKRNGFNLIKLQEHWMIDEPTEGQVDFSRYEELITHAATLDLGIYLGITCEQAPAWLYRKHPDCRMIGRGGVPILYEAPTTLPADGKPGPCYDHPGALADQLRFIAKLVKTLGKYENLVVWNIWQEIGYWAKGLVGDTVCFCDHTLEFFHGWLHEYFGDLDILNRSWKCRYHDWIDILPSRADGAKGLSAVDVFWQYFMDNVQISRVLKNRAEAIRIADPLKRPVFAHKGGPIIGAGQDWSYARCQDFLGSSCYPAWSSLHKWDDNCKRPFEKHTSLLSEMWAGVALHYDYIRSANPAGSPVWAAEFQGGPVSTGFHKGRVPRAEDIRRWMLTAVASGVTAISFWVTRAEIMAAEMNGFSLLDSEGETTLRLEEAGRIGSALNAHADLFGQPTLEPASVGILINEWNYQFCSAMSQGGENLSYSVRGWYRLLWDASIPVDFVEVSQLGEKTMKQYRVLILPFPLALSEDVASKLTEYVEGGGYLISEACPGRVNEYSFCNRGELSPTMRELFGVHQGSLTMVREPEGESRWSPPERTWGEYCEATQLTGTGHLAGHSLRANVYLQTLIPIDAEPCLLHGKDIAGTYRPVGLGSVWLFGTYVGHSGTAYRDIQTQACLRALLAQCNLTTESSTGLLRRRRITPTKEAWVFTNPSCQTITETFDINPWEEVSDLLGELMTRQGNSVTFSIDSLDLRVLILQHKM